MDSTFIWHSLLIVGLAALFVLSYGVFTHVSDSQRRNFSIPYYLLILAWFGIVYYLEHSNKLSSAWIDGYQSCAMCLAFAWPYITAYLINRQRYPAIIRFKRTLYDISTSIIWSAFMIYVVFLYAPSYYARMPFWNLILFILSAISVMITFTIMAWGTISFHENGILRSGFLWAWSDFESYSWKDNKLLLQKRKGRPLSIKVRPEQREMADGFLQRIFQAQSTPLH